VRGRAQELATERRVVDGDRQPVHGSARLHMLERGVHQRQPLALERVVAGVVYGAQTWRLGERGHHSL